MTHIRWESAAIGYGVERWEDQALLMDGAVRDLGRASVSGLAPSVQGAASSFLSAWAGYAGESQVIAEGFVAALRAATADMSGTDEAQGSGYADLDGRLGPAR